MPTLEELYHSHLDMIFRICSRYTRDREEAEDLTQETFLRIDRNLVRFRGDSQLGTWIYRIATNCCLDHLRKHKSRTRVYVEYLDTLVLHNLSPEGDRVLAKIDLDRILAHLRPGVRHILFLTLAEGLSYREAGEVAGISRDAVGKIVGRFLKKFKSAASPAAAASPVPHAAPGAAVPATATVPAAAWKGRE
jgi:RNA polymerase sigma-70 factor, ECF subfamily